jgi:Phosphotriesterase family
MPRAEAGSSALLTLFDVDPRWGSLLDNLHVRHSEQRRGVGARLLELTADAVIERRTRARYDAACFCDFMVGDPAFANESPDYLLISRQVIPALLAEGVTHAQIDQLMVENPRRFFAGDSSPAAGSVADVRTLAL